MLKKILYVFAITFFGAISAQTTLIDPTTDGGFETGATFAANGWTPVAGPNPLFNQWTVNTGATGFTGIRCAYITNNTTLPVPPHANSPSQAFAYTRFYREVSFPAGENDITLSFDWIGNGNDVSDLMRVWLVPSGYGQTWNSGYTPTGTAPTGRVQLGVDYHSQGTWTNATITVPSAYMGNNARLVFEWRNNGTVGTTPGAVDNISLVTQSVATYCTPSSTSTSYWIEDFSTSAGAGAEISNLTSGLTAGGYQDNSATEFVDQYPGGSVDFTVDFSGTTSSYGFNIWVDWDNDGDFLSNVNEKVFASGTWVTGVNADFVIPLSVTPGNYRMRIRADWSDTDPDPCGAITNGEAEDYTVTVIAITCTDNPSTASVSAIGLTSATISWTAASPVPAMGYEYFIASNTNPPIYGQVPTGTTTATSVNLTGLTENTNYTVWVRSICDGSAGGSGLWQGPEQFTTLATPPTTTDVSMCPGDTSQDLTASGSCNAIVNLGTQISGSLNAATDPVTFQPDLPILGGGSQTFCAYETVTANYEALDFTIDISGTYTFNLQPPAPSFDAMGYIVVNDGTFVPGSCATGTWILGDDDSGPNLDPQLVVNLIAGVSYTIYTTKWSSGNTTHTGPYTWDLAGPGSIYGNSPGTMNWYDSAVGGTLLGTGSNFDPVGVAGSGLPDTNTAGVYTFWAACASAPNTRTPAYYNIGKLWNGSTDSNWNTASNWSPSGVPLATDCVVIENTAIDPIIDGTTDAIGYRLIVKNGSVLTQNSNSTLTITDAVTVDAGGTYTMQDSSSLIQDNNVANTVNGTFTMDRTVNMRRSDYVYWSSPVTSFPIENISPLTPNGYKYDWNPTLFQGIGPPGNMTFGEWESTDAGAMTVGKGYAVKGPNGHPIAASPFTATFSGTPNNGTVQQTISRGAYTGGDYLYMPTGGTQNLTVTADDDNWNFIGNPYPSALHLEDFLYHTHNTSNLDGFAYIWTHNTAMGANGQSFYEEYTYSYSGMDYLAINRTGTSIPTVFDGFIAAGQGFYVLMTDTNTTSIVEFQNYMRDDALRNDQFFRSADVSEENAEIKHRIWLDYINPSGSTNTTLVAYVNGATDEKDRMFDAKRTKGEGLNLYSLIDEGAYIIQGRQTPFVNTDTVPLGINITEAGIQTLAINTLEGLFADTDQEIYIEDMVTGITHNLTNAPFSFTSDAGIINDRFVLRYTPTTLSVKDFDILKGIKVFEENDEIIVKSEHGSIQSIEVYDILARNLFSDTSINLNEFSIGAISPNNATLLLKIKLVDGQQKIAKIIF